jgi:RNA polymerase sigma-B factor
MQEQAHVTLEMVAGEVSVDLATAELAVSSVTAAPLSLDRQSDGLEGPFTLQDKLADESAGNAFDQAEDESILRPLLQGLDPRQRRVIRMRYGENRSCYDIGEELRLSPTRVKQIEQQALRSLRRRLMTPGRKAC